MYQKVIPQKALLCLLISSLLFLFAISASATNPPITNNLVNLSQGLMGQEYEENVPEMIIEGNTIHTLWTNWVGSDEAYLFYRRSTDLGETWESPQQIYQFKDGAIAKEVSSIRMAVSGNNIYLCFADYDYYNNGTGYIYFASSTNNGESFGAPIELANSGGGYNKIYRSYVRASGNNIAIVYDGDGAKEGVRSLFSSNNGASFNESIITEDNNGLSDFWYDGNQMIVVYEYAYYFYGLNTGRVYVSVSDDNGASFTSNKVSVTYNDGETERCRCYHDQRYVPKVTKDGNNIHLIFAGYNTEGIWTILYTKSTNNGQSFESAVDINKGLIGENYLQAGQESVTAKGGNVYLEYLSTSSKAYIVHSDDSGATLTDPKDLLPTDAMYIKTTWWPQLQIDPTDETGKTVYFGSGAMMTRKSTDGGQNFTNSTFLSPFLESGSDIRGLVLKIDDSGNPHWLGKARWYWSYDFDIFYGKKETQPEPGLDNKALLIETIYNEKKELVIVPSSPSIAFDSTMTGESWIKVHEGSSNKLNVFSKVNGYDGDTYQPSGYQMTFHESGGKRYLNSGIETDKGQFINWTGGTISDTLWHHIAFTYDANAGLNNFKTYFDGLLVLEQTVTGVIIPGDGLLMMGSRQSFYQSVKYQVDDIRLWNRALSQEEILENQVKTFTGNEDGLKLWLNFDDTFKDISGNGNDAIPLYLGELKTSNFDPPITSFDLYQFNNEVSLNNKTQNANSFFWDFGNTETSELGNPKYTYPSAGEYYITLKATNENSITSAIGHVTIEGMDRVEPSQAGNLGYATITVFGGGLNIENASLILRKDGEEDIIGEEISAPANGVLSAKFDLYDQTLGNWDIVASINASEMILPSAFSVIQGIEAEPWVNVSGRGAILYNMWQTYTINYGNNGNVDAYMVPLWLAFTNYPEFEIEFVDFEIVAPDIANELDIAEEIKSIDLFFETDSVLGKPMDAKVYPFIIPVIPANSSSTVHFRIKTPDNIEFKTWMNPPYLEYVVDVELKNTLLTKGELRLKVAECVTGVLAEGIVDIGTSAIPGVGCLWSVGKQAYKTYETPPWNKKGSWLGTLWNTAITVVDCGVNLSGAGAIVKGVGIFMANMGGYAMSIDACNNIGKDLSTQSRDIDAVSSFDPNEMIGPSGFGEDNYITKNNMMPYTVLFENYSTATAPAHIVTVSDTLNLSKFDLSEFGFSSFGWGDTILTPPGNKLKEFSMDIDMRPEINLITRVSGNLDELTGVVLWEFLSLNPETMNLEEDPFIGFLPPNTTSPEGEGFVSFAVALKEELGTNSEIRNKATIIFDANEPIITNEYLNILDLDFPESEVNELTETSGSNFIVDWSGTDLGSGICDYSIYVLENDTNLYQWIANTTDITAVFEAAIGSSYKFYSIATDNVNHMESETGQYDAWTSVVLDIENKELDKGDLIVFPNPADKNIKVMLRNASCGVYLIELIGINGSLQYAQIYNDCNLNNGVDINIEGYRSGQYILKIVYENKTVSQKIMFR